MPCQPGIVQFFLPSDYNSGELDIYRLSSLAKHGQIDRLPYSIKILLEALLRNVDGRVISEADVIRAAGYDPANVGEITIPFKPARVILQDFTGVPAVVDLAALRTAMKEMGGDPKRINPLVPVDLVVDHSVQVDYYAAPDALERNMEREFERNRERYEFLHWGQRAFDNFRVVPPSTGIIHQVNLEYLSDCVPSREIDGELQGDAALAEKVGSDMNTNSFEFCA